MADAVPLIEARGIAKRFGGVAALSGVDLVVMPGEVLAVVGENGAGKSTLMKTLAGIHLPDEGDIRIDGAPVRIAGVADATRRGIVLIHQELNLALNLSVAANVFLGRERTFGGLLGLLSDRAMNAEAARLMDRVGLAVSPTALVGDLAPGQRQLVEIARALSLNARAIIMDEPTSSLTQRETDRLYLVIDELRAAGVAVLYISHRLAEVKRVADRATVLRDGKNAGELPREKINHDNLVRLMVGRDLKQVYPARSPVAPAKTPRLRVRDLRFDGGRGEAISFDISPGEIVGMAGLVGAGRTETAEALFGLRRVFSGTVEIDGVAVSLRSPKEAISRGLLLVPEDRRHHGLILTESIRGNLSLPNLDAVSVGGPVGWISSTRENALAADMMARLQVKASSAAQPVGTLSGGNQQKVVLGKWLARGPRVLILDEPTRGVDVGARSEIYSLMNALAAGGTAILMISSDMEEVLGMSDGILVLHEGRLAGQLSREQAGEEAVMQLATGGGRAS